MNILAISRHLLFFGLNRLDKLSPIDQNNIMKHKKTFQIGTFLVFWRFTMFWRSIQSRAWNQTKTIIGRHPQNSFKIALQIWLRSFYSSLFQSNPVTFLIESFLSKSPRKRVGPILKTKLNFACLPTVYLYVFSYSKDLSLFHFLKSGNCRDGKECFTRWNNESKW